MSKIVNTKLKITTLYHAFSKKERKQFIDFVNSPFFNKDQTLITLASFLDKALPNNKEERLTTQQKIEAYTKMFGNTKSKQQLSDKERPKLNDKLSKLANLAFKYLEVRILNEDSPERTKLILSQLKQPKYNALFEAAHKKEHKHLNKNKQIDNNSLLQNYLLERSMFEYRFQYDIGKLLKSDNLETVIEAFDSYYLIERMMLHLAGMALLSNVGTKSYDFILMNWILNLSEAPKYNDIPAIKLCRTACHMETCKLLSKDQINQDIQAQQHYEELVSLLSKYDQEFANEFKEKFYMLAINFCIHQTRIKKNDNFQVKGFELYKLFEEKGLMIVNERVRAIRLINGISFACQSGNHQWAEEMYKKYLPLVRKYIHLGVSSFIPGQIAFYQGQFEKADRFFMQTELAPPHRAYTNNCKVFRLKCLYEINNYNFEIAKGKFKTEKAQRRNSQILSQVAKTGQTHFITVLSDLYSIRDSLSRESKSRLLERLSKTEEKLKTYSLVSDSLWLEKKIAELHQKI